MLRMFSKHTSMGIFLSHKNLYGFFVNRWNHEELWNCSNIILNLYDIIRDNCLYYQVCGTVLDQNVIFLDWYGIEINKEIHVIVKNSQQQN